MSYSSDEKTAAVGELVQGTLSFQQDALGPLNQSSQFTEVMETVYGVLLYDPDAIYYLIYLTRNALKRIINAEDALCDELLDAIDDLAMPNRPVNDISGLSSARNSLQALDSALARSGSLAGSEFRRYQQALTRFKQQLGRTVRMTYVPRGSTTPVTDVVRPSSQAKFDTTTYFKSLKEEHDLLLQQLEYVQGALTGFSNGKLTSKVGQRQVLRAETQLEDLEELLEGLTGEERILQARQALLTVLANESVVKALATLPVAGTSKFSQPVAAAPLYRLSAHGEGEAPVLTGTLSAPFKLYDTAAAAPTNLLRLADLNGVPDVDVDLFPTTSPSFVAGVKSARITGSKSGDFAIAADLDTPRALFSDTGTFNITASSDWFYISVDGVAYRKQLVNGAAETAANVATDIDTAAGWIPSKPAITASVDANRVKIVYTGTTLPYGARSMRLTTGLRFAQDLWLADPGPVYYWWTGPGATTKGTSSVGWDGNDKIWVKANDDPAHVVVTLPAGTWPDYQVSAAAVAAAIDAAGGSEFTADVDNGRVRILSELEGEGSIVTMLSEGVYLAPAAKQGYGSPSLLGLRTLGFVEQQESRETDVSGESVVNMLNEDATFSAEATARLSRRRLLSARRAQRAGASLLAIPVDEDPLADWPPFGEVKVAISGGDARGVYQATSLGFAGSTLSIGLDRRLRDDDPTLLYTVGVYSDVLELTSSNKGLTGLLEAGDPPAGSARAILGLDSDIHTSAVSELELEHNDPTYGWRALDVSRLRIRVGDLVLNGISEEQATITSVGQLSSGILAVTPSVSPSFSLSTEGFSVQSGAYVAYLAFMQALETWVADTLPPFEEDLKWIDQALSPILLTTPARDRVDTAYARVSMLKSKLAALTTLLDDFVVAQITAVDSALQALLEQGYDRARQLLITGQIDTFFSATAADASFSRNFQKAANDVVVQDVNRASQAKARFDSEFVRIKDNWEEDLHPDHDFSDLEEEPPDDAMVDYYLGVDEFEGT